MTAPTDRAAYERAGRVQEALESAMGPGGSLHLDLEDLLARASGVAMDAADVPDIDNRGPLWPWDPERLLDLVRWEIAEEFFKVALRNAEPVTA